MKKERQDIMKYLGMISSMKIAILFFSHFYKMLMQNLSASPFPYTEQL